MEAQQVKTRSRLGGEVEGVARALNDGFLPLILAQANRIRWAQAPVLREGVPAGLAPMGEQAAIPRLAPTRSLGMVGVGGREM